MPWIEWYNALAKPAWTPSPSTISLIWILLYPVIVGSFVFVFVQAYRKKIDRKVSVPFAVNAVSNLLFMPLFSGLRSIPLATLDILLVWATILWMAAAIWKHDRWVAIAQIPYFVWVSIASVIQVSILFMNWGKA